MVTADLVRGGDLGLDQVYVQIYKCACHKPESHAMLVFVDERARVVGSNFRGRSCCRRWVLGVGGERWRRRKRDVC